MLLVSHHSVFSREHCRDKLLLGNLVEHSRLLFVAREQKVTTTTTLARVSDPDERE